MTQGLEGRLAPTDCRLRPDQHFLELGQYDKVGGGKEEISPDALALSSCPVLAVAVGLRAAAPVPAGPGTLTPARGLCTARRPQANAEKQRLEHKQRAARKAAERGEPIRPRWFEVLPADGSSDAGAGLASAAAGSSGSPSEEQLERQGGQRHLPRQRQQSHKAGVAPGEQLRFKYRGGYWEERAAGHFTGCRDIFGPLAPTSD